ncbi:hypothetical protein P5G51_013985 [Virgibacillus sp. 179-BFC.A HS]|uniref:Dipeptidylpeptidase IV N-terminal domain-containing protein n=1 Tax=Tigheibacillus jepli TaxID=3035914 RepID=A0ABU5CJ15_9BACI|nr:hypothetical protein [Virgibacillus sp. 179-BFC.A HS]MDY0406348.1 hypothetical protein [Virgibacillus sp. 179-BFC.A HS]
MAKRALTANDLTELVMYSDPQLTPDGDTYFFVETVMDKEKDEYRSHLFTQKVNSSADEKQTYGKQKDSHPRISPDGKQVVFQSDRSGVSQLWLMPADGGEAKQLTTFQYGAYSPEWSKDGKYLFFSAPLEKGDNVQHQKELTREERQKQKEEKSKQPMVIDRLNYKSDHSGFWMTNACRLSCTICRKIHTHN